MRLVVAPKIAQGQDFRQITGNIKDCVAWLKTKWETQRSGDNGRVDNENINKADYNNDGKSRF